MKIKQKRQVNLPQLIEWVWEKEIKDGRFLSIPPQKALMEVWGHRISLSDGCNGPNSSTRFEIEEEIEIDEDTKLERIVVVYLDERKYFTTNTFRRVSILDVEEVVGRPGSQLKTIHYLHDDGTMTLIWKDGAMVE